VRYVDAGYTICLAVLFCYAVGLVLRRRRLSRALAASSRPAPGAAGGGGAGRAARPEGGR
jgi:hypothetical protein